MPDGGSRPGQPAAGARAILCPYCGEVSKDEARCESCRGHFDPLSRQATQNSMGPWFIRDAASPFRPGCSFEVLRTMAERGKIELGTIIKGPTTNQFWSPARRAPGVANLLGVCHNCGGPGGPDDVACLTCGATFRYQIDRQHLGLTEVRLLPGHAAPEVIAAASVAPPSARPRPRSPQVNTAVTRGRPAELPVENAQGTGRALVGWLIALAAVTIVGAVVAAAWIMGWLPGFVAPFGPEPVTGEPIPVVEAEAPPAGPPPAPVLPANSSTEETVDSGTPAQVPSITSAPDHLDEAQRLLRLGTEDSLRQAVDVAGRLAGVEGAQIAVAAGRLLAVKRFERLP
jgi:hypothetical protein